MTGVMIKRKLAGLLALANILPSAREAKRKV
jgi:hypothetical protein